MRRSSAQNQGTERQRLSFATCRKCGKVVAALAREGQNVGDILYENGFRLANRIELEIEMECVCCWEIQPLEFGFGLQPVMDLQRQIDKAIEREMYESWEEMFR